MSTGAEGKEHELEQWLDATLARHGKVEPRPGLENRVLATFQAEKDRLSARRCWWALGTAAAAATVGVVMWFGLYDSRPIPNRTTGSPVTHDRSTTTVPGPAAQNRSATTGQPRMAVQIRRRKTTTAIEARAIDPKLDQFPSAVPLTDQEEMLARYVREFHERAVLVARAQTQLQKQEAQERLRLSPSTAGPKSSDQLE